VCDGKDPECATCMGTGKIGLRECPWKMIGHRERFVCELAVLVETGLLPFDLGWSELPANLVAAWRMVAHERHVLEERRRKQT